MTHVLVVVYVDYHSFSDAGKSFNPVFCENSFEIIFCQNKQHNPTNLKKKTMVSSLLYTVLALQSFCIQSFHVPFRATLHSQTILHAQDDGENNDQFQDMNNISRRSMIDTGSKMLLTPFVLNVLNIRNANAAVGDLPEFSDANAVLQGLTLDVSDSTQQKDMVEFLRDGFSFKVLRQRKVGSITETVGDYIYIY